MKQQKQKKSNKKNPTPIQQKGAKAVVENLLSDNPKPTGQVLESVGYSKNFAEQPSRVIESGGFQQALASTGLRKALEKAGINSGKIAEKINVLLEAKNGDNDDYGAIDKGLKHATAIYGITDEKDKPNTVVYNFFHSPDIQETVKVFEQELKDKITND